jgi:valyl-tRNA synthetase
MEKFLFSFTSLASVVAFGGVLSPKLRSHRWSIDREKELIDVWDREGIYRFTFDLDKPLMAIDTPPPYTSGKWHVGAAAHYAQIDMIARFHRMYGWAVLVPFYADRNGLPVEVLVEKTYGINPFEIASTPEGRLKFLEMCRAFLDRVEEELVGIWRRIGCSFEYWRDGTDSPEYRRISQSTFIDMWRRGLIYEAERPVMWCPRCKTTLAEAEIDRVEEDSKLYYLKFRVEEDGREIVIATTRPELLNACEAVVYNPEDGRYEELYKLHAVIPLYGRSVPILKHSYVKPDFGTGLVMVCSYGDVSDVRMFRDLGLKPRIIINPDGTMNEEAGNQLKGLNIREARSRIVKILSEEKLIVRVEEVKHEVPVCWRCKTPIEYINMKEYFLKQLEFRDELLNLVKELKFYPEEHKGKLIDWINSLTMDWPISKTRFYANEIPLWRCGRCSEILVPEPGKYYRPWIDKPPWDKCPKCGAPQELLKGELKVFDTWFDSSISPLYISGYLRKPEMFSKVFGNILRPQGYDIIRTWYYYTILRVYLLTGKPAFKWSRITGMGLDDKGRAMHKSLGNVVDPEPIVEKYGADAFRYWAAISARLGGDYRWSEKHVKSGALFTTKIWNIARFISSFPEVKDGFKLKPIDEAILTLASEIGIKAVEAYKNLDVYEPINQLYNFTWNMFADHYIEAVKPRAYNTLKKYSEEECRAAWYTLHTVLKLVLKLLAPIMPFITDYIWRQMYDPRGIHIQRIDEKEFTYTSSYGRLFPKFMELNSKIWKYKRENGVRLSEPLDITLYIPEELEPFINDIKDLHRVKDVKAGIPETDQLSMSRANILIVKL